MFFRSENWPKKNVQKWAEKGSNPALCAGHCKKKSTPLEIPLTFSPAPANPAKGGGGTAKPLKLRPYQCEIKVEAREIKIPVDRVFLRLGFWPEHFL